MPAARYDARTLPLIVGRTPLLPLRVAVDLYAAPNPYAHLRELIDSDARVRQMLAVASPSLYSALREAEPPAPDSSSKLWIRALCYVLRSSFRTTPYGLCAGFGTVEAGATTNLRLSERWETVTQPDMEIAHALTKRALEGEARATLRVIANPAVVVRGGRLYVTHVELMKRRATKSSFVTEQRPVSLRHTDAVRFVRENSPRLTPFGELAGILAECYDAPMAEAARLLSMLLDAGVLLTELAVTPIGDPFEALCTIAGAVASENDLGAVARECSRIDGIALKDREVSTYERLESLCMGGVEEGGTPLHVDLVAHFDGTLGSEVLSEVERMTELFDRAARRRDLRSFRDRFVQFYEGDERMVPLLELVDEQLGPGAPDDGEPVLVEDPKRLQLLRALAADAQRTLVEEVELSADQVETLFPSGDGDPHGSRDIAFFVGAKSQDEVDSGRFTIAPSFLITDCATLSLGRFALPLGREFTRRMREVARRTCASEAIVAELVFVPEPRAYNVIRRPRVYDYEVRVGVGAEADAATIGLEDLWVGLDGDRFFLWSRSHQREVKIRESHAFVTPTLAPTICRFLSLLSAQERPEAIGPWADQWHRYTPRLRVGRSVLALRSWRFYTGELGETREQAAESLRRWRSEWNLPRYVCLRDMDSLLLLDLESSVVPQVVLDQARAKSELAFSEVFPPLEQRGLPGFDGAHAVEFVASLVSREPPAAGKTAAPTHFAQERRLHGPGSSWTYLKLYLGVQATDAFVSAAMIAAIDELRARGAIDDWFWLRYADPERHLRLRVHSTGATCTVREALIARAETWLASGEVRRVVVDTFAPEYERYGGAEELAAVLRFFTVDSTLCAALLSGAGDTRASRVGCAAESFNRLLLAQTCDDLVVHAFQGAARAGVIEQDREVLRALQRERAPLASPLGPALQTAKPEVRIADLLHMHCNRIGVEDDGERRVAALVRGAALGRRSRQLVRKP